MFNLHWDIVRLEIFSQVCLSYSSVCNEKREKKMIEAYENLMTNRKAATTHSRHQTGISWLRHVHSVHNTAVQQWKLSKQVVKEWGWEWQDMECNGIALDALTDNEWWRNPMWQLHNRSIHTLGIFIRKYRHFTLIFPLFLCSFSQFRYQNVNDFTVVPLSMHSIGLEICLHSFSSFENENKIPNLMKFLSLLLHSSIFRKISFPTLLLRYLLLRLIRSSFHFLSCCMYECLSHPILVARFNLNFISFAFGFHSLPNCFNWTSSLYLFPALKHRHIHNFAYVLHSSHLHKKESNLFSFDFSPFFDVGAKSRHTLSSRLFKCSFNKLLDYGAIHMHAHGVVSRVSACTWNSGAEHRNNMKTVHSMPKFLNEASKKKGFATDFPFHFFLHSYTHTHIGASLHRLQPFPDQVREKASK